MIPHARDVKASPEARAVRGWRAVQWLTVGLGLKRWAVLSIIGLALAIFGAALGFAYVAVDFSLGVTEWLDKTTGQLLDSVSLGTWCLVLGICAVAVGLRGVYKAVERVYEDETRVDFLDTALKRRRKNRGERVVAIGGGTGLSTMLRGLKHYTSNITAVVTMADDGGSSGKLREGGMLPPGDLRNCIAALAEAEPLMQQLFQHRFKGLGELEGHSVGNLIVAAMYEMTGDFDQAVRETSKVLAIRGQVLPSTLDDVRLGAELKNGTRLDGQKEIAQADNIASVFLIPEQVHALPSVIKAIQEAEIIVMGPGSLFTSVIPNLLVPEIASAIKASKVPKIYVCNVMTQPNETKDFSAADHVRALIHHVGQGVITHVLLNSGKVPAEVLARYETLGAHYIAPEEAEIEMLGVRAIHGAFVDTSNVVRHNPEKLSSAIFRIAARL